MGYVVSIVNMKGGVGKTTVTVNLATCLAKDFAKKVLVVDLDMQINATLSLLPPLYFTKLKKKKRTLRTLINQIIQPNNQEHISTQEVIRPEICQIPGFDLLPGDIELYNDFYLAAIIYSQSQGNLKEFELNWQKFENQLIKEIIKPVVDKYDFIFLDFPPGDHLLTRSGLLASELYLVPAKPEPLSVIGVGILEGRIQQLKKSDRTQINLIGILFNSRGHATKMAPRIKKRLGAEFGEDKLFTTEIPVNVAIAQAVDEFKPVVLSNPQSSRAKAFSNLTKEFLKRVGAMGES